jgi:hypothetical protein
MIVMGAGGGVLAAIKMQRFNVLAGFLTFYLVTTAWLTVKRKPGERRVAETLLLLLALGVAATSVFFALEARSGAIHLAHGESAGAGFIFALVALLFALGDVHVLMLRSISNVQRLTRHLCRMCVALFVATGSFFLGTASDPVLRRTGLRATLFTKAVRATHLPMVPIWILLALTIFWLLRVRLAKRYRNGGHGVAPPARAAASETPAGVPRPAEQM